MSRHAAHTPPVTLSPGQRVRVTWDRTGRDGTVLHEQGRGVYCVQIDGARCAVTGRPLPNRVPAQFLVPIEMPAHAGEGI